MALFWTGTVRNRLQVWGLSVVGSLLLHVSVAFAAVYLAAAFLPFPSEKPVEMEVVVLEFAAQEPTEKSVSDPPAAASSGLFPEPSPPTNAGKPVERPAPVKPAEAVEAVISVVSPKPVESIPQETPLVTHRLEPRSVTEIPVTDARPLRQKPPATQRVIHREAPQSADPVPSPERDARMVGMVQNPSLPIKEPAAISERRVAVTNRLTNVAPQVNREIIEAIVDRPEGALPSEPILSRPIAEVSTPEPVLREVARLSPSPLTRLPVPETTEEARESERTDRPVAQGVPVKASLSARPDFGWVAQALWQRLGQLKRYPYAARINRWEGTVVVRAVVKQDGDVADLVLEQSSGHEALDEDALELLRRVSPLPLQFELGRPELQIRVPITYKLE